MKRIIRDFSNESAKNHAVTPVSSRSNRFRYASRRPSSRIAGRWMLDSRKTVTFG